MRRNVVHLAGLIYRLLLHLYPADFREMFGEEMTAVFTKSLSETARTNWAALLFLILRELRDYPPALLREHRHNLEENPMSKTSKRIVFLAAVTIFGIAWRFLARILWGSSLLDNWGLLTLVMVYWPFVLAGFTAIGWLFAATIAPAIKRISYKFWLAVGLLTLVTLSLPISVFRSSPGWMTLALINVALIINALLLNAALPLYTVGRSSQYAGDVGPNWQRFLPNSGAVVALGLSLLLLIKTLHNLYWLFIWDSTYDPLDILWLFFLMPVVLITGIYLFITLRSEKKWAGLAYLLFVPALFIAVYHFAQQVDFRQFTEERAARTSQAVEAYYMRVGHYPESLEEVAPWYIFSVPEPVIIYEQRWCYDSGADYYRLGYVYREHWSDPRLSGKLYKAAGALPDLRPLCMEEVASLKEQYPWYQFDSKIASE